MKLTLIAAAGVLAALIVTPAHAGEMTSMKEGDPMKPGHPATSIPKIDQSEEMKRAEANFKTAKAACSSQSGSAKESCVEEAKKTYETAEHDTQGAHSSSNERTAPIERAARNGSEAEAKCGEMSADAAEGCMQEAIYKRQ